MTNAGFESGSSSWYLAPQASIDTAPADAHTGNGSLQLVATGPWQGTWQAVAVTAGQPYTIPGGERAAPRGRPGPGQQRTPLETRRREHPPGLHRHPRLELPMHHPPFTHRP